MLSCGAALDELAQYLAVGQIGLDEFQYLFGNTRILRNGK